ncbi:MAG: phosphoribosylformylglycinamidine synthase subunit PurS [Elusimicrobiota bacterium]|jgi:phosphoribosylformylglycinamidine (FGAM) synthase PurS component
MNATLETPVATPTHRIFPQTPLPTYIVEVASKLGSTDSMGQSILQQLPSLGIAGGREIRVSALYEIQGRLTLTQIQLACRGLLCDPITQEFRTDRSTPSSAFLIGPHWRVEVWLKPQVTDPVGESVRQALPGLGLPEPSRVRTGTAYHILGKLTPNQVERIANKLLANAIIHQTKVSQS